MHEYVFSIGSNCGDRHKACRDACQWLQSLVRNFEMSGIYETKPYGHDGSDYMNAVVRGTCQEDVHAVDRLCKEYELAHGRDDVARAANKVPVDIDIVIADGEVLRLRDFNCEFFRTGYDSIS